mgnify:CR=1 FL=1
MAYDHIIEAVRGQSRLTPAQEVENYAAFSDLQKNGVYLPELMKKMQEFDDLKKRFDEMDRSKPSVDAELFAVMEQTVRDDPGVKEARRRMSDEKTRVINEICMRDEGFRKVAEDYRKAVNAAYLSARERDKAPNAP